MRKVLFVVVACLLGNTAAIAQSGEMSLLQATLVVACDVFVKRCPQHVAFANRAKHDAELAFVKRTLTPAAGDNSYDAIRKRVEPTFKSAAACDRELQKHKAQTYPAYTYSNITLKQ